MLIRYIRPRYDAAQARLMRERFSALRRAKLTDASIARGAMPPPGKCRVSQAFSSARVTTFDTAARRRAYDFGF